MYYDNDEEREDSFKIWIQDNIRIVISILIVIAIAGGIYSYSKRPPEKQKQTNESAFEDKSSSFKDSSSNSSETELNEIRKILCK